MNLRKEYVRLVEDVREAGGEVKIFSSMHISGERMLKMHQRVILDILILTFFIYKITELSQLTGVAAILRFPMPELEDADEDEDDDEDSD